MHICCILWKDVVCSYVCIYMVHVQLHFHDFLLWIKVLGENSSHPFALCFIIVRNISVAMVESHGRNREHFSLCLHWCFICSSHKNSTEQSRHTSQKEGHQCWCPLPSSVPQILPSANQKNIQLHFAHCKCSGQSTVPDVCSHHWRTPSWGMHCIKGYAGSPSKNTGMESSPSMTCLGLGGILPSFSIMFKLKFANILASIVHTARPLDYNIHGTVPVVTTSLDIQWIATLPVNIICRVACRLL